MGTSYNDIAGQSVERIAAISDGVFAVAMTLLVLDLRTPAAEAVHTEGELARALLILAPRLLVYMMSFMTLGIFWIGQQTQSNHLARSDRNLSWINLGFLFAVSLMPFSTALMAEFITLRVALLLYWLNIVLLGGALLCAWRYATGAALLSPQSDPQIGVWVERRIVIAQALYAFGAVLSVISTYCSIGFIILVQLNYVLAPRLGVLRRI